MAQSHLRRLSPIKRYRSFANDHHNGRQIFYVIGRYPADVTPYPKQRTGRRQYPVVDLVICHGDFLNADHNYVHKKDVGQLIRVEANTLVVGYTFDLRTNELHAERISNPSAGAEHRFVAYRLASDASKSVSMVDETTILDETFGTNDE